MHKTSQTLPISGLLIGCVLFGMGSLIVAHVSLGAYAMAFWRLVVSSLIFVLLACIFRQKFPTSRPAMVFALLSGAALGLDLALWHESIYALGPGISTLLNSLQIFFLALIGFVFYQEKQSKIQLASLVLAVIGVGLIASPEFGHNAKAGFGLVAGIVSGACLAISMTWIRQAHRQATVAILPLMSLVGIGGSLAMLPLMLWLDYDKLLPVSMTEVGWILVYGVVMQCLAWGVIAYSIPKLSLALTGLLLLTEPVAALVLDYFWLHKPINAMQWFGATLTMLAIYVGSVSRQTY
ncbi:DMT family transporter [Moraxella sp. ZJ142]|uniref:DMT family transporter n=1 Tax=Moraxella marmotae TaxID=3344520 RepID=UPI0035D491D6